MGRVTGWSFGVVLAVVTFIVGTLSAYGLLPSPYGALFTVALGVGSVVSIAQSAAGG